MAKDFSLEVGQKAAIVIVGDDDSALKVLHSVIKETNGDVQIVPTDKADEILLIAARVGRSILTLELKVRNETGGVETVKREINVVVTPRDEDEISLFLCPIGHEKHDIFVQPETTNEELAKENTELREKLNAEKTRADELQELIDQHNIGLPDPTEPKPEEPLDDSSQVSQTTDEPQTNAVNANSGESVQEAQTNN